ncbi:hypothetical protein FIBSPDRAFT_895580 [Athelia psychrophila]|uniref:Uncharacterized protein n=1 Tax=Athelia psychrophila TaxID=1759441 RepID=A0A166EH34_9AGAM|nr:hypothetical protein FIBSPDRAFT_895580 [Fibularhizoctonia sp. CBS 109695]
MSGHLQPYELLEANGRGNITQNKPWLALAKSMATKRLLLVKIPVWLARVYVFRVKYNSCVLPSSLSYFGVAIPSNQCSLRLCRCQYRELRLPTPLIAALDIGFTPAPYPPAPVLPRLQYSSSSLLPITMYRQSRQPALVFLMSGCGLATFSFEIVGGLRALAMMAAGNWGMRGWRAGGCGAGGWRGRTIMGSELALDGVLGAGAAGRGGWRTWGLVDVRMGSASVHMEPGGHAREGRWAHRAPGAWREEMWTEVWARGVTGEGAGAGGRHRGIRAGLGKWTCGGICAGRWRVCCGNTCAWAAGVHAASSERACG